MAKNNAFWHNPYSRNIFPGEDVFFFLSALEVTRNLFLAIVTLKICTWCMSSYVYPWQWYLCRLFSTLEIYRIKSLAWLYDTNKTTTIKKKNHWCSTKHWALNKSCLWSFYFEFHLSVEPMTVQQAVLVLMWTVMNCSYSIIYTFKICP